MKILVTGASGFVGRELCIYLGLLGYDVIPVSRRTIDIKDAVLLKFGSDAEWSLLLEKCDYVIHLAGRAHIITENQSDPLKIFRAVNVVNTKNLARLSARYGIQRFIFISSIKVNGEFTQPEKYFTADDIPSPKDPYGISKWEAEKALQQIASETGLEVVIIRPPLVYGPNAKGNFASMVKWLRRGVPLPFGNINNQRSLVSLENLCDLILQCTVHPAAAGQTFMVSDNDDLSTTELLTRTAFAMGIKPNLFNVPQKLLELSTTLLGQSDLSQRLFGSLQVDISKTRDMLNWKPLISVDEGLKRAVSH
jgi:nucleoside-diphosphate-sugar epimerase